MTNDGDDDVTLPTNPGTGLRYVGVGCGIVPFFVNYTTSSSETVNGQVVSAVYRNWVAVGGGALALLIGLALVRLALRSGSERNKALGWAGAVLALALYQLVMRSGFVF